MTSFLYTKNYRITLQEVRAGAQLFEADRNFQLRSKQILPKIFPVCEAIGTKFLLRNGADERALLL
jgi:hypothetical protein